MKWLLLLLGISVLWSLSALAVTPSPPLEDREIIERLTRLEVGQKSLETQMNQRFESLETQMNQRFEAINQRFAASDQRFESLETQMNQQFDRLITIMVAMVTAFAGIVAVTIGFAVWDRRTMIRPFETKVKSLEAEIAQLQKTEKELSSDSRKFHNLLEAFRTLSKTDNRIAEVLRTYSLL